MASIPYTINNATPPYNISVKRVSGDTTERFISYINNVISFDPVFNSGNVFYTITLTDANGCTDVKTFGLNCTSGLVCTNQFDIMFVIDESGSISDNNFSIMKNGIKLILDKLKPHLDSGLLKIGWSKFGRDSTTFCAIGVQGLTSDYNTLVNGILATAQGKGGTPMAAGLREGYNLMNLSGSRDVPRKVILITDGSPNIDENCLVVTPASAKTITQTRANTIKTTIHGTGKQTEIVTVGIGINSTDSNWMRDNIASSSLDHFLVSNFTEFQAIADDLASKICE